MNRKYPHFAIPEIYGESLSYYELLRKLVKAMNIVIENYDTIPDQIAEAVANLDASQLFSEVLKQLIESIATDNTKSANAVKVYKKHDLLYATFNDNVNLYESLIDFSTGTTTELIPDTNIREVNISELFIELRKLIDINKNNIEAVTTLLNENSSEITTMHNDITSIENKNTEQDNEITTIHGDITAIENKNTEQDNELNTLRTMLSSPYNFKGDVSTISALPARGEVNDTYYVLDVKYKVTWTGSAWAQSSLNEADYQTELSELKSDLVGLSKLNLYGIGYKQNNSSIDTNGSLISNDFADVLTYTIPSYVQKVRALNRITISGEIHALNPLMAFYDDKGSLLKYINGAVEPYSKGLIDVVIPKGAKVVKFVQSNQAVDKNDLFVGFCTDIKSTLDRVINNYLDDNDLLTGGYISNIGELVADDNNNFWYTDYIETTGGYISYNGIGTTNLSVISFYDSDKKLLSNVTGTGLNTYTTGVCSVPTGTKFVRYCTLKNNSFSSLDVNDMEFLFTSFNQNEKTELHDITWLAIGDSITSGDTVNGYAYPNYIADNTGVILIKEGHSGYTMESLYNIRDSFEKDVDTVTVFAGTNDFNSNKTLGKIDDNTTSTFYGTLNLMMKYMQSTYNNDPVIFFTPIRRNYTGSESGVIAGMINNNGDNLKDFADAIIACGKKHGVPVVDLFNDSGIGEYNINGLTSDGVHPNARGQKVLAGIFKSVLHKYTDYLY